MTEQATNAIDVYPLGPARAALPAAAHPSQGETPYGLAGSPTGAVIVSKAASGSLSSFRTGYLGGWTGLSSSVPHSQTPPCWVMVANGGRVAYTANADSNSIPSHDVSGHGTLALSSEVAASTGETPTDLAVSSADGGFLYVRDAGAGEIEGFQAGPSGALSWVTMVGGLPSGAEGLAAL